MSKLNSILRYLFFAVLGRIVVHFLISDASEDTKNIVPFIGALAVVMLWPHVVVARNADKGASIQRENEKE